MARGSAHRPRTTPARADNTATYDNPETTDSTTPSWDSSPNTLASYLVKLTRWLPRQSTNYRSLIEGGWVLSKGTVNTVSDNHSERLVRQMIPRGTVRAPCQIGAADLVAIPADPAVATPDRYKVNTEAVNDSDQQMLQTMLDTILDNDTMETCETLAAGSGRTLLVHFQTQLTALLASGSNYGQDIEDEFNRIEREGIGNVSVTSFNSFKSELNVERKALPPDRAITDGIFANKLITAVRALGPFIANRLDIELRVANARGDLALTTTSIVTILSAAETDARKEAARALAARPDAPRNDRGDRPDGDRGPRPDWVPSKGRCPRCKTIDRKGEKGNKYKGNHWSANCPNKDEADRLRAQRDSAAQAQAPAAAPAAAPPPSGQGRGNLVASGEDDSCSECEDDDKEEAAAAAFFTKGKTSLVNLEALTDPEAILEAVRGTGDTEGRSNMVRPLTSDDEQEEQSARPPPGWFDGNADQTGSINAANAEATGTLRLYLLPTGPIAGIYYGTWNAPDNIRLLSEGVPAPPGRPVCKRFNSIETAVDAAHTMGMEQAFYKGPHIHPDFPTLAIGDDSILVLSNEVESSDGDDASQDEEASEAASEDDNEILPAPVPVAPPTKFEPKPTAAARAEPAAPPAWQLPPGLLLEDHPLRATLRESLARLYRLSQEDDKKRHAPPAVRGIKPADVRKVAQYTMISAGGGHHMHARQIPPTGSQPLVLALRDTRSALSSLLSLAGAPTTELETAAASVLATTIVNDFHAARCISKATPERTTMSIVRGYATSACGVALKFTMQTLVVLAAASFLRYDFRDASPPLMIDPGMTSPSLTPLSFAVPVALASAFAVAAIPVILALVALTFVSLVSQVNRVGLRDAIRRRTARLRASPGAHSPLPRHLRPPGEGPRHFDEPSKAGPLGSGRQRGRSSATRSLQLFLASGLASSSAPMAAAIFPALALVAMFFHLGGLLIDAPPIRPPVPVPVPASIGRRTCAAGGLTRFFRAFRRVPSFVVYSIIALCAVGCNTPADDPVTPLAPSYRAKCNFHDFDHFHTPRAKRTAAHHTQGRALQCRPGKAIELELTNSTLKALLGRKSPGARGISIDLVLDSGCTMHCHPFPEHLINRRPSNETMRGISGKPHRVQFIGDLPISMADVHGKKHDALIRNVRCVPAFTETLISVDQLWEQAGAEARFANHRKIYMPDKKGRCLKIPFKKAIDGLYTLNVLSRTNAPPSRSRRALMTLADSEDFDVSEFHRPSSRSHFDMLNASSLAAHLHHRLHLSPNVLAGLPSLAKDVPNRVKKLPGAPCPHCVEANATRHKHKSPDVYKPSFVGRLIHSDIVGPFKASLHGGFKYAIVFVDDHSRFKAVYFMAKKSEALKCARRFVSALNAHLSVGSSAPARPVGALHCDNAGEYLSLEFKEFLDEAMIQQSTCPPYVHSLNGVAERAIRSIMENARSHMVASGAPISFWPYAVEHAVDILNRSTSPPNGNSSSYEMVFGTKPKVMPIQPFGCRAVSVLPRHAYSKRDVQSHGITGINLGKAPTVTGAYRIWIPSLGKIATNSDVYFDPTFMPWRPKGDQRVGPISPVATNHDSHEDALRPSLAPSDPIPTAATQAEAFDMATRGASTTARSSLKVLVLFSGPSARPDGLNAFLKKLGLDADMVDSCPDHGGGASHDLLSDSVYRRLLDKIRAGEYFAILAAPPCSTFSVARHYGGVNAPRPLRNRLNILGLPGLSAPETKQLNDANALVIRTCALLAEATRVGCQWIIENPVDRGDRSLPRAFSHTEHGSIWVMRHVIELAKLASADVVHFSQCMIGAPWQKRTTLMFTPGLKAWLTPLAALECDHQSHEEQAGGKRDPDTGKWISAEASAYPAELNFYLAKAFASLHVDSGANTSATASPVPTKGAGEEISPRTGPPDAPPAVLSQASPVRPGPLPASPRVPDSTSSAAHVPLDLGSTLDAAVSDGERVRSSCC